jgi:hypothetical protein
MQHACDPARKQKKLWGRDEKGVEQIGKVGGLPKA